MKNEKDKVQRKRIVRVLVVFLMAFLLVGLSGIDWQKALRLSNDEPSASEDIDTTSRTSEGILSLAQQVIKSGKVALPEEYSREIGLPVGSRDVRVMGNVVGFVMDCEISAAARSVERLMDEKGWSAEPLGGTTGSTFEKSEGSLSWAMITFSQVNDATSVVVRFD